MFVFALIFLFQDFPTLPAITGLGVGGILAGLTLAFYRVDRVESEKRLAQVARDFREIVERNTQAITLLTTFLAARGSDRGTERES